MHTLPSILRPRESGDVAESAQADLRVHAPDSQAAHAAVAAALAAAIATNPANPADDDVDDDDEPTDEGGS